MSESASSSDWWRCNHCGGHSPEHSFYDSAMCSRSCRQAADAETILNKLKHDHTVCITCFRRLKTIDKPPESVPDVVQGFQYRTPNATWGEKQQNPGPKRPSRLPSKDRPLYAYEVQDDVSDEVREYYPARKFDWANEREDAPVANEPVNQGTVCQSCGNSEHNVVDHHLRSKSCSTMLVGHHLTNRVRELDEQIDEHRFFERYARATCTIREGLEEAVVV